MAGNVYDLTLDAFRKQLERVAGKGAPWSLAAMAGLRGPVPEPEVFAQELRRLRGMIDSMTRQERSDPSLIGKDRTRRIAAGSGTDPVAVERLLHQFEESRARVKRLGRMRV
jgi:signal recognition particle subunit SRP54